FGRSVCSSESNKCVGTVARAETVWYPSTRMVRVGVPRETAPGETRVALIPETVAKLVPLGFEVLVEAGAGAASGVEGAACSAAGATVTDVRDLYARAEVVAKVREPMPTATGHEADQLRSGVVLVSFLNPGRNPELIDRLAAKGVTTFVMEYVPRITRA